ncbi:MAG: hypothetical protein V1798_06985 [Pseudomonadota bacterium]
MRRLFAVLVLIPLLLSALPACGKKRVELLSERAEAFSRSLRWGSLTAAGVLIADDRRRSLVGQLANELARARVVDYSIVDLNMDPKEEQGTVVVEYSYYTITDQELLSRQEIESWKFSKGSWFLTDIKPVPMPSR